MKTSSYFANKKAAADPNAVSIARWPPPLVEISTPLYLPCSSRRPFEII